MYFRIQFVYRMRSLFGGVEVVGGSGFILSLAADCLFYLEQRL